MSRYAVICLTGVAIAVPAQAVSMATEAAAIRGSETASRCVSNQRMPVPPAPVTAPAWMVKGRLIKVDGIAQTATIRHPRLPIGLPAATTVFRVSEPLFIQQMKYARDVRFSAAVIEGVPTLTHLDVPLRKRPGQARP